MKLKNTVALITGGAQGIGKHFALTLLNRGANVVVADINQNAGINFEKEALEQYDEKRLKYIKCDVSNTKELHRTFEYGKEYFGHLDIICNNAGIMTSDVSLVSKQVAVNLTALIEGTYKGIDLMSVKNGGNGGVIVNISSGSGYNILKGTAVYTATKYGVVGFSRSFEELPTKDEDGVRVNCICPFFVDTDMLRKGIAENSEVGYQLSLFGYADIDDVAKAFVMCIEDNSLNGEVIAVHAPHSIYPLHFRSPVKKV